jgi:hypothetical protein
LGLARRLLAFAVSFTVVLSSHVFAFASPGKSLPKAASKAAQIDPSQRDLQIKSVTATATKDGVLLYWNTNSTPDNLGFNIYRLRDGQRVRVNREIIGGALFGPGTPAMMPGYSYSWFDRGGTINDSYVIESVTLDGATTLHQAVNPVSSKTLPGFEETPAALNNATGTTDSFAKQYPAEESHLPNVPNGPLQQQWDIAGQTALKIGIKQDGWYRVTQPQMVAAGFNLAVDIRNLRLFSDGNEVAINTSQSSGQFGSGDYIEFYGRGLDVATTDTRVYYLIVGTTAGKRVGGEIHVDGDPVLPPVPVPTPATAASAGLVLRDPVFNSQYNLSWLLSPEPYNPTNGNRSSGPATTSVANPVLLNREDELLPEFTPAPAEQPHTKADGDSSRDKSVALANAALAVVGAASRVVAKPRLVTAKAESGPAKTPALRKRKGSKRRRPTRAEHNHAAFSDSFAPANFPSTLQVKERFNYLANLLNGDAENYFGRVISSPVTFTLNAGNADLNATTATVEVALQGVQDQFSDPHSVTVSLNGVTLGSMNFGALAYQVQTFNVPAATLLNGSNSLTLTKTSSGEFALVDYVRLTYPHAFNADTGSLRFNLRGSQTRKVDGFAVPSVRLIDYTDSFNVSITKPSAEASASGYAITVPMSQSRSKDQRLFYAIAEGQFDQPASLTLSQPSTLNLNSNAADFVIITYHDFISALDPLVTQRHDRDHFTVKVVDIDDVYDEFSYGTHGPQAIRSFLQHAKTNWATPPRYVIFAGDASLDPRHYQYPDLDLVPTKLVDATFNETASDDWLTDFDDDGVADIPVGRLPIRDSSEATLLVSKIVNYSPASVPQSALLVADDPGTPPVWDFESGNDNVQALLPPTVSVQRVNVRTEPSIAQATTDIRNAINQGQVLVNYSGHGNVDVWSGSAVWRANPDATGLTNGMNKLTFVVVMDCLNGYFQQPNLLSLSEAFLRAPNGGAFAAFASSGLTTTFGQRQMELELYRQLYGSQSIALGDAIKIAKAASDDIDVKRTWIFFGDPSLKIR